jgi:hypothetical protein
VKEKAEENIVVDIICQDLKLDVGSLSENISEQVMLDTQKVRTIVRKEEILKVEFALKIPERHHCYKVGKLIQSFFCW